MKDYANLTSHKLKRIIQAWSPKEPLPGPLHPEVFRPSEEEHGRYWYRKGKVTLLRGLYHEELLKHLLEQARIEQEEKSWLLGVRRTPNNGFRDCKGIDLTLLTVYGKIQVQVKSSKLARASFLRKRRALGLKPIACVVVNTQMSDQKILESLVMNVRPYLLEKKQQKQAWDRKQASAP